MERSLNQVSSCEELYWKQRAKTQWLKDGDANTAFFHNCTIQKRRRNRLERIKNHSGDWEMDEHQVRSVIKDYFKNLFTSEGPRDWGDILAFIPAVISDDINATLLAPISDEEIRITVFQMGALKSPGPDGFSGIFYQKYWSIVGHDVCRLVSSFFSNTISMEKLNRTEIALIPKVPNLELVTQFRPISLCNYSYKIISKILANRLQPLLDNFISPQQCAFIPGRQIQDNVLVAHEAFHSLKIRRNFFFFFKMGLKLDISKAYDRIE